MAEGLLAKVAKLEQKKERDISLPLNMLKLELTEAQRAMAATHEAKIKELEGKLAGQLEENSKTSSKFVKEIKGLLNALSEEIQLVKSRKGEGASMPRDWREDSSTAGTLTGTLNGVNMVYTLSSRARINTLNVFYNGTRQNNKQYTVNPTAGWITAFTFTELQPISTDEVSVFYSL